MKTSYKDDFGELSNTFRNLGAGARLNIGGHAATDILSIPFTSRAGWVYPDSGDYFEHGSTFRQLLKFYLENSKYSDDLVFGKLETPDSAVAENSSFRYYVFKPSGTERFKKATFLLHGLNEKQWDKYLPWAQRLAEETAAPVILFPIAFHMNRAPEAWANPRSMMLVAKERKRVVADGSETSFLNAALSHRIQFAPHRFFSSGMHTFYDIIQLVEEIRMGGFSWLEKDAVLNFFGYSIGASLSEVLITSNYNNYFNDSKLFLFCGGAALDIANPVSKTIMDKEAYTELFGWLRTLFDSVSGIGRRMKEIFFQDLPEVLCFKSFLFYDTMMSFREEKLAGAADRISSVSLVKDKVFPPAATEKTLHGHNGGIGIRTEVLDFPFEYRHEDPFPLAGAEPGIIDSAFDEVFDRAGSFLGA